MLVEYWPALAEVKSLPRTSPKFPFTPFFSLSPHRFYTSFPPKSPFGMTFRRMSIFTIIFWLHPRLMSVMTYFSPIFFRFTFIRFPFRDVIFVFFRFHRCRVFMFLTWQFYLFLLRTFSGSTCPFPSLKIRDPARWKPSSPPTQPLPCFSHPPLALWILRGSSD